MNNIKIDKKVANGTLKPKIYYILIDDEARVEYKYYDSYKEAKKDLMRIEKEEKEEGYYIKDFYKIKKKENSLMELEIEDAINERFDYSLNITVISRVEKFAPGRNYLVIIKDNKPITIIYQKNLTFDENINIIVKKLKGSI